MKISICIAISAFACLSFNVPDNKSSKVEMRLSFPSIKKKFAACKDSSLLARLVIYNRTDSLISFPVDGNTAVPTDISFEIITKTSSYIIEQKGPSETRYKILFPGDSVIFFCLLTSQSCQATQFTRRVPSPAEGLRSVRATFQFKEKEEDMKPASYDEDQPLTTPGPNKQRNAVRREEINSTPPEVVKSLYKGMLNSNIVKF